MKNVKLAVLIFVIGEVLATLLFYIMRKAFGMEQGNHRWSDLINGLLERLVLLFGLYMSISQIVAMFGVFKVAARLKADPEDKKTNNYFLMGNLASVALALTYFYIYTRLRGK
jgi:hypothetical protein